MTLGSSPDMSPTQTEPLCSSSPSKTRASSKRRKNSCRISVLERQKCKYRMKFPRPCQIYRAGQDTYSKCYINSRFETRYHRKLKSSKIAMKYRLSSSHVCYILPSSADISKTNGMLIYRKGLGQDYNRPLIIPCGSDSLQVISGGLETSNTMSVDGWKHAVQAKFPPVRNSKTFLHSS